MNGTFRNGPGKRYARCDACGAVDYERYEGDRHHCPDEATEVARVGALYQLTEGERERHLSAARIVAVLGLGAADETAIRSLAVQDTHEGDGWVVRRVS